MPRVLILILPLILDWVQASGKAGGNGSHWGYEGAFDPSHWYLLDHAQCDHKSQSPINVDTRYAKSNSSLTPIHFNYDTLLKKAVLFNNGHTVQLSPAESDRHSVKGGGFGTQFIFAQLHFHWGSGSNNGSEHTINGQVYPLEMHLVHYNYKYKAIENALKYDDGLAVIGVMFHVTNRINEAFTPIVNGLSKVKSPGTETILHEAIELRSLLPRETTPYYRYQGSLTTPPCSEVVIWTLLDQTVPIGAAQLEQFRNLENDEHHSLADNFRPLQPLGVRKVQMSGSRASLLLPVRMAVVFLFATVWTLLP